MDRLVELASRIRKAGLSYSAGGKLYHRYDGRSEDSNQMEFDWRNGVLDGAIYPEVVSAPVSEQKSVVVNDIQPTTYIPTTGTPVAQVYQSNIPEDASAYSGLQYGALLTGDTLERVPDISIPYAVEGYGKTAELSPEQREIMRALQDTGYDRARLESGLLLSPSAQSRVLSDGVVTDSSRGTYLESKLLGESDAEAVRRAVDTLKGADVDTIKAVQTEMFKKGYYEGLATPRIPIGTKEENMALQRKLKSFGYDLGTYGENKDGVDGKIGKKTREAWSKYVKEHPDEAVLGSVADGKVGPATRRALAKYYKDASVESLQPSLSMAMYENISDSDKTKNLLGTVLPAHIGAYINGVRNKMTGAIRGMGDDELADAVEEARLQLKLAKLGGDDKAIAEAQQNYDTAFAALPKNKLNREDASDAEIQSVLAALTSLNGDKQMTYQDYMDNIALIGGKEGDYLAANPRHKHLQNGKDVMLYGGRSVYDLMNAYENKGGGVQNKIDNPASIIGSLINAEARIYNDPQRGRLGSFSYYLDKEGNVYISDKLEATEKEVTRGANDDESYNRSRDFFPRATTSRIAFKIPAAVYGAYVDAARARLAQQGM